jgi:Photosynthesis system II assembly factor YCF48
VDTQDTNLSPSGARRDAAIEALLKRATVPVSPAVPCPDAELLAAYYAQALDEIDKERWETHFASCLRCQDTLSAMATSEPLGAEEQVEEPLVPEAVPLAARPVVTKRPSKGIPGWLIAAVAAAAVIAFLGFRHSAEGTPELLQNTTHLSQQPAPVTSSANPSAATPTAGTGSHTPVPQAAEARLPKSNKAAGAASNPAINLQQAAQEPRVPINPVLSSDINIDGITQAQSGQSNASAAAAGAQPVSGENFMAARAAGSRAAATSSSVEVDQVAEAAQGKKTQVAAKPPTPVAPEATAGAPTDLSLVTIFPSAGNALWRIGYGGHIEKSTDSGQSWQLQQSGVNTQLLAGSAPNNVVCWVVGSSGTILRTTDGGAHWQKLPEPSQVGGALLDWTSVYATDASHAHIGSVDARHFATADGGQTWTPADY